MAGFCKLPLERFSQDLENYIVMNGNYHYDLWDSLGMVMFPVAYAYGNILKAELIENERVHNP